MEEKADRVLQWPYLIITLLSIWDLRASSYSKRILQEITAIALFHGRGAVLQELKIWSFRIG